MAQPLARDVAEEIAKLHGVCIRPIALKRLDMATGKSEVVDVPCGSPLESKCPPCAKRNRQLRMAQCSEGWHLDEEPITTSDETTDGQRWLVEFRADMQAKRDEEEKAGGDTSDLDAVLTGLDIEINEAGMRGNVLGRERISTSTRVRFAFAWPMWNAPQASWFLVRPSPRPVSASSASHRRSSRP